MRELLIRNRQRTRSVNVAELTGYTQRLLETELGLKQYALGVELVGARAMAEINWRYLRHRGATDIITFDHRDEASRGAALHGELFICVPVAEVQAKEFGTRWFEELGRYVIHGILHLRGYDDLAAAERRLMKREEARLLHRMSRGFPLSRLGGVRRVRGNEA